MSRVLVIEDNADLALGLRNNLEIDGHTVEVAADGAAGLAAAAGFDPDLIVLDLMLPDMDGLQVLRRLRAADAGTPVLILTARGEEADKVRGLKLGADDYVTKPFGLLELLARVEVLLRRTRSGGGLHELYRFGEVEVDVPSRQVARAGEALDLTPKEFELLLALLGRDGAVATRDDLLTEVWGYSQGVVSRTVDTHVASLRGKIELCPQRPCHLLTVRKAGYRLAGAAAAR